MHNERLQNLMYLADRSAADYIVAAKRMKIAEKRMDMMEALGRHMCLSGACDQPVTGKKIFAHCPQHLDSFEENWLRKDVETHGFEVLVDGPLGKAFLEFDIDHAKTNVSLLEDALKLAHQTSEAFWEARRERRALLPAPLLKRIQEHEVRLFDTDDYWFYDQPPSYRG